MGPSRVSPTTLCSQNHDSKAPGCHICPTTWKLSTALAIACAFGGQLGILRCKPSWLDPNGLPNPLSLHPGTSCCPLAFLLRPSRCSWQDPVSFCGAASGDGDPPPCMVASGVGLQSRWLPLLPAASSHPRWGRAGGRGCVARPGGAKQTSWHPACPPPSNKGLKSSGCVFLY